MQCALTKLAYLLSKPELSVRNVRDLIGKPLRGELTPATGDRPPAMTNAETVQDVLSHMIRISTKNFPGAFMRPNVPPITLTLDRPEQNLLKTLDVTAEWGSTASETVSTEAALFPFLMHLAAARDDVDGLRFCLDIEASSMSGLNTGKHAIAGGMVNCVDPASGRTPLHAAALSGSLRSVNALLEAGALVHMRDALDHTALYYVSAVHGRDPLLTAGLQAARQGFEPVVEVLVKAGGHLGGSDFRLLGALSDASKQSLWTKAGAEPPAPLSTHS